MDTERNKRISSGERKSPGRVVVDRRGRNVWQWNDDQLDSTTIMLQRLDNSALELEPTRSVRRPKLQGREVRARAGSDSSPDRDATESGTLKIERTFNLELGGGFDPYNRS